MVDDVELAEVLIAAAAGDVGSWQRIVERFAPLVWSVARSHSLAAVVAADVAQICWLRLTECLDEVGVDELGCWLAAGARAESLHALRWNDPRWDTAPRPHLPAAVATAVEQLPARSRVAVELHGQPGVGPRELGAAVGLDPAAAAALATDALRQLGPDVEAALREAEPVPTGVVTGALAAYSWRAPGLDVGATSYDSLLDEPVGVRSGSDGRLLTYAWGADELDLEVTHAGARRSLVGRLTPGRPGRLLLRHGGAHELLVDLDASGGFAVPDLAPGALRVHLDLDGAATRRTSWVLV